MSSQPNSFPAIFWGKKIYMNLLGKYLNLLREQMWKIVCFAGNHMWRGLTRSLGVEHYVENYVRKEFRTIID